MHKQGRREPGADEILDVRGKCCPEPALEARRRLDVMAAGRVLKIIATDPLATVDLQILCDRLGHRLLESRTNGDELSVWIRVSAERRPGAG
ncbi:MAG: sulfurtransferase TusA family protein [Wenzhouxiangella sp.]|nr:MAG: sulfurtransferase TusA family protein [Wenzhouxiangella sp.]